VARRGASPLRSIHDLNIYKLSTNKRMQSDTDTLHLVCVRW